MFGGILLAVGGTAVLNWVARWRGSALGEWLTKPLVTVLVMAAAVAAVPVSQQQRSWFLIGLMLCLAGDVFLMLPREQFVAGLGSFLFGHVAFIVGFTVRGSNTVAFGWLLAVLVVGALLLTVVPDVLRGVRSCDPRLLGPVVGYVAVILTMVALAARGGGLWGLAGGIVFAASDSLLAWDRFVSQARWTPTVVMMTYHAALVGLVLSLR